MAQSSMTVVYALLGSAALLVTMAVLVFAGILDIGVDPLLFGGVLVAGAVMDLVMVAVYTTRLKRQ